MKRVHTLDRLLDQMMPRYDHALIVSIDANSYEESLTKLYQFTGNAIDMPSYEHDNSGQRMLYLHPEGFDNSWECE